MNKPLEIVELEIELRMELFPMDLKSESFLKINKSYSLDSKDQVIALNLRYSNVKDLAIFEKFPNLISLHLGNCEIERLESLGKCKSLKYLNLESNKVKDISPVSQLNRLQKLILESNDIENVGPLKNLKSLEHLNLAKNQIYNIDSLKTLINIRSLIANDNCIQKIDILRNFPQLERINFSNNEVEEISALKGLLFLQEIQFTNNLIFDVTPIYIFIKKNDFTRTHNFYGNPLIYPPTEIYLKGDNQILLWFENILDKVNRKIDECLKNKKKELKLSNYGITDLKLIPKLFKCIHLESLILSNEWAEYKNYDWTKSTFNGNGVRNNLFEIPQSIKLLKNLKRLIIGGDWSNDINVPRWRISDAKNLTYLTNLQALNISNNKIVTVKFLDRLEHLIDFHFNNNKIESIPSLKRATRIISLNASNNQLKSIEFVKELQLLEMLDLHSNNLTNIDGLENIFKSLIKLVIDSNPIVINNNWKLTKYENHLKTILNYFSKKLAPGSKEYKLPVKVLLLGNHASGKSTLLDYLLSVKSSKKIIQSKNSTHVVRIEQFKTPKNSQLPKIIYFDFGGQDYYHGIYKAFLTNDAINILLWSSEFDYNKVREDSNGLLTRDFTKEYWLHQLKHYYLNSRIDKIGNNIGESDTALIVQTRADINDRVNFVENVEGINVINNFWLALNQEEIENKQIFKINIDHFEETLKYVIEEKIKLDRFRVHQPVWYLNFIKYILASTNADSIRLDELIKEYKRPIKRHEKHEDIREFFIDDLDQLHRQGLILFYKDLSELQDVAWLSPSELTKFIHEQILSKDALVERNGIIDENIFLHMVSDAKIIKFLQMQKVIFHDVENKTYLIPSFLPLANDINNRNNYEIMTFGFDEPNFVLKFNKFIPFGIVNQMICHFGNNPDSKHFWRDQLVFTLDKNVQVLIKLDFDNLEISAFIKAKNINSSKLDLIESYMYNCILAIYHDIPLLNFNSYEETKKNQKREFVNEDAIQVNFFEAINILPHDLFISIDNHWFVKAQQLNNLGDNVKATVFQVKEIQKKGIGKKDFFVREVSSEISKEVLSYKFQNFTNNKLIKLKKVFISYSKDDLKLINEFQDHLTSLKRAGLISSWYCTELIAGGEWDKDIARHFDEADIICFMVSPNFMRTDYIYKHELKKAHDRRLKDKEFVIIPIILDFCSWSNAQSKLGDFTALPYTAKPICDFDNRNMAWYIVVECIKYVVGNYAQPEGEDWFDKIDLPKDVRRIYERIVEGLVDKNQT